MHSIAYVLIASLAVSGVAVAADDPAGSDEYGATPECQAGQKDRVSDRTAPLASRVRACEGEHWEGEDEASANRDCADVVSANTISTGNCGKGNSIYGGASDDPGQLGVRVSQNGAGASYVSAQIGGVGQANVYQDGNGLVAIFLQDFSDTLGFTCIAFSAQDCNALAEVVHAAGITQGAAVGEEEPDCTIASYGAGTCTRDNTAVTVDVTP